ncbi:glycosyltransferase family 2 protein [Nocardioides sp. AN3]
MTHPQSGARDDPERGPGLGTGPGTARRIVAVVVTYNRLPLLQRLLERLDAVRAVDEVLVVDNASTDGTSEWLASLEPGAEGADGHHERRVLGRTLATNTGGAGGFAEGVAWAVDRGADLVWLMDDDGVPAPDCLERLLERGGLDFWGPVVVNEAAPERLVFPIRLPGGTRVVHDVAAVEHAASGSAGGVIEGIVIPFNGVLVTRGLVERIGVPRADFFIWGDDHEFRLRAEAAGARIATVAAARFLHPSVGSLGTPMMFGATTYNHSPSDLKHYCMARNNLLNQRDYQGWPHALAFVAKTAWFYLFTRPSLGRLVLSARAMYAGLRGDFTGHERFLR